MIEKMRSAAERRRGRNVIYITSLEFTQRGRELAGRVKEACGKVSGRELIWKDTENLDEETFRISDAVFFFCAAGIAVRKIAPFVKDKTSDPAVLVMGEDGKYVISLLSGHLGGANVWTREIAQVLEAQPVITTASDVRSMPSLDEWAAKCGLEIDDMKMAKRIAAYLLSRKNPEMRKEQGSDGPENRFGNQKGSGQKKAQGETVKYRICITDKSDLASDSGTLILRPKCYVLGVGCRRDTNPEAMKKFLTDFMKKNRIDPRLVKCICSVDRKKDEKAVKEAARMLKVPFTVFSAEELASVPGSFSTSDFVRDTVGVDNVCERAALLGAGTQGQLTVKKTVADGMTAAAARNAQTMKKNLIMTPEQWLTQVLAGDFPEV